MRSIGSILVTCLVLALVPVLALANGMYSPTVGTRAGAMGGAFIGLADDYSAVYWNPAGITQIKGMEVTVTGHDVVSLASREGFVTYQGYPGEYDDYHFAIGEVGATANSGNRIAPGFFFYTDAGPLRGVFDKVGITAYTLSDYGAKWNGSEVVDGFVRHPNDFFFTDFFADKQDYESRVRSYVISPVVAKEVIPGLSLGLTANLTYSHFELRDVTALEQPVFVDLPDIADLWILALIPFEFSDDVTAWGFGATFGALYRVNREFSVGLSLRSPMTIAYEGTFGAKADNVFGENEDGVFFVDLNEQHDSSFDLRYPMWVGAGLAYRDLFGLDGLTVAGDVQWTDWSTFEAINRSVAWDTTSMFSEPEQVALSMTNLRWDDTVEIAVGFDYRLGRSLSLHAGYRNSPSPVPDETYDFVMPSSSKSVYAVGASVRQDFWRAAFALEYQAGAERDIEGTYDMNGKHVEDLLIPSLSFTYAF